MFPATSQLWIFLCYQWLIAFQVSLCVAASHSSNRSTSWGRPACQAPVWSRALDGQVLHDDGPKVMKLLVLFTVLFTVLFGGILLRQIHELGGNSLASLAHIFHKECGDSMVFIAPQLPPNHLIIWLYFWKVEKPGCCMVLPHNLNLPTTSNYQICRRYFRALARCTGSFLSGLLLELLQVFGLQLGHLGQTIPANPTNVFRLESSQSRTESGWWLGLPLWKIWKSIGMIIRNIWKNEKCSKPPTRVPSRKLT